MATQVTNAMQRESYIDEMASVHAVEVNKSGRNRKKKQKVM